MSVPERLGRYRLREQLGEGGMGIVHRAEVDGAEGFSKSVAIKMVHGLYARDPGIRDAFLAEAQTAQRLVHGNIVQIIDFGIEGDQPYMVMELVDGVSLARLLEAAGGSALPVADAMTIAENVASALAYAHGLTTPAGHPDGVIHRDITPRNILISRDGVVKLADFGIAKAMSSPSFTLPGVLKGSLGYLAPEQALGEEIDGRADQFSTAVVLYQTLSGDNPLAARDVEAYLVKIREPVPPLPTQAPIDAALAEIVARATALDRTDRYPSMDELRGELEAWRVERKIRTSAAALRQTVRRLLGEPAAEPVAPRPLGAALGNLIDPGARTEVAKPARAAHPARGRTVAVVAVIAALVVIGIAGFGLMAADGDGGDRDAGPVASREVRPPPAAPDAAAPPPVPVDRPAVAAADAMPADPARRDAGAGRPIVRPRRPPAGTGVLSINLIPYAKVTIDGKFIRETPLSNHSLRAGPHEVVLENPGLRQRKQLTVTIEPGKTHEITKW